MSLDVENIKLQELEGDSTASGISVLNEKNIGLIGHLEAKAEINIGRAKLSVEKLYSLKRGEVIELEESVTEYFTLMVEGKPIAKGNLVVVGDKFAFDVAEII